MNDPEQTLQELKSLYKDKYVSFSDLEEFKKAHVTGKDTPKELNKYFTHREKLNRKFLKRAKKHPYKMGDYTLDAHQTMAVMACEDADLILAPAGSGKTATLLAKVDYLIRFHNMNPENILIIAFTNKVVDELKDRLENDAVEIRTFHSLGNKIIKTKYKNYKLITEENSALLIHKIIARELKTSDSYAKKYHTLLNGPPSTLPTFIEIKPEYTEESFEELIVSAISLQKSERLTLKDLKSRLNTPKTLQLYDLYAPIYRAYTKYLKERHIYDFADMLNLSTDFVNTMPDNSFNYEYILVDEAQDLSESKCELLKAILKKCHKVKLFAVGDDWQSIYRFAGSNLKVLDDFEKTFARTTYRGIINFTYRFGQPTAKISNRFIRKNKYQSKKRVTPATRKYTPIEFKLYDRDKHSKSPPDYEAVDELLQALYHKYGNDLATKNLQIISRYNRDIFRLVDKDTNKYRHAEYDHKTATLKWRIDDTTLEIPYCTIHKAKGITRDIVIAINMNDGESGMPASRDGNPLLEPMLAELDDYPFAEERRLFYVAITRAKELTILVADHKTPSPFLLELNPQLLKN